MINNDNILFKITDLQCSYNGSKRPVLNIESLIIHRGKIVFLIGASGSGKSTLLETLGLMNNTLTKGEILFIPNDSEQFEYSILWNKNQEYSIASIRKKHFSFIFQNTNLMENFTAYENVSLAKMIKEEITQSNSLNHIGKLMNRVGLPESEVHKNTLAMNLSGGQRQRLAFVRALSSDSSVLLCDEPTGNLDESNANELFEVIAEAVHKGITAIVVSHDINLALKYANEIILITKNTLNGYGQILSENIISRSLWENLSTSELFDFKEKLRSTFNTLERTLVKDNNDVDFPAVPLLKFTSLFFKRESSILAGRGKLNLIVLTLILLVTLIAIGFANGSMNYLQQKLNSAYVKWLTVSVPFDKGRERVQELQKDLDDTELQKQFGYSSVSITKLGNLAVRDSIHHRDVFVKMRTFDPQRDFDLLKEVGAKKHRIRGATAGFTGSKDLSIIVTSKLLDELGYGKDDDFLFFPIEIYKKYEEDSSVLESSKIRAILPIPIRSVVDELPGKARIACTDFFYSCYVTTPNNPFEHTWQGVSNLYVISREDSSTIAKWKLSLSKLFDNNQAIEAHDPEIYGPDEYRNSFGGGYTLRINFDPPYQSYKSLDSIYKMISDSLSDNSNLMHLYDFSKVEGKLIDLPYDVISVYFNDLEKVRPFSDYLYKKYNKEGETSSLEVDDTRVVDKENFFFLSTVTRAVAYIVILFGGVSVSLFIFNLLKMHLNKVKMNIGTFKAIGLTNSRSRNIYFAIIIFFIVVSTTIAVGLSCLIGEGINKLLIARSYVEKDVSSYFILIHPNTAIAIAIFLLSSLLVSYFTINRILSKSPGDLIYNR
ncbi:MAG TPA: ATP-binding cassette domain-containing protein [Chitinophagales bacterium]|nr:ATP-binding cassette domain-containing protein [Chitinophagales bacterium]